MSLSGEERVKEISTLSTNVIIPNQIDSEQASLAPESIQALQHAQSQDSIRSSLNSYMQSVLQAQQSEPRFRQQDPSKGAMKVQENVHSIFTKVPMHNIYDD